MMGSRRRFGGGGWERFRGRFTRTGKAIALFYASTYILGFFVTNVWHEPFVEDLLLHPLGRSSRFHPWQLLTHLLFGGTHFLGIALSLLLFWWMGWQIERDVGRRRFLFLVFGIPFLAGLIGLPFTLIVPSGPLASFSLVIDVLIVAFAMIHRHAFVNLMFLWTVRASQLLGILIGFHLVFFILLGNPSFVYQMVAIGMAWAVFRYDITPDPKLMWLRFRAWRLRRRQQRFFVIRGGKDNDDDGPMYH